MNNLPKGEQLNMTKALDLDRSSNLVYLTMAINESMRKHSPINTSPFLMMIEETKVGTVVFRPNDKLVVDIGRLHNNPD